MKTNIPYEKRLVNILNFLHLVCIEGNGYDLKQIIYELSYGEYGLTEALLKWKRLGWYFLIDWKTIKEEFINESKEGKI